MNIAYVSLFDPSDDHAWSGTVKAMRNCLVEHDHHVDNIFSLKRSPLLKWATKKAYYRYLKHNEYDWRRDPAVLRCYARQINKQLRTHHDLVFSPGTVPIALLECDAPIAFWTDATFACLVDFYPENSNLCAETIRDGHNAERLILERCKHAIYSSEWAARSAIDFYGVDPAKVKVVPFGAHVPASGDNYQTERWVERRGRDVCKLLFVGVDWSRKGGEKALAVANCLKSRGLRPELHVVGCDPPEPLPDFVISHGFLSKKCPEAKAKLHELMAASHFLIVPSIAECYGLVFAEASSYGVPSLTTNVGGIPTVVTDGRNGHTFAVDAHPHEYCECIEDYFGNWNHYKSMAENCVDEFRTRLNWQVAGSRVGEILVS